MRHLDTNIVIAYLNEANTDLTQRLEQAGEDLGMSTIALAELLYGVRNSTKQERNLRRLEEFLPLVQLVPFDARCADVYGTARVELRRKGLPAPVWTC